MRLRLEPRDAARWKMRARQLAAVVRLEIGRLVRGRRLIAVYLLTLLPVLALVAAAVVQRLLVERPIGSGNLTVAFALLFGTFTMRCMIFFSCAAVFVQLVRGEVLEKTLHYYFLAPVRREVVIAGKFLAGLIAVTSLCCASVLASHLLTFSRLGGDGAGDYYANGPGAEHLLAYLAATALACIGYGAVFTLLGVLLRNPVIPALLLLGWEGILFLLPQFLKQISVAHYVTSLLPVRLAAGPLAVVAEPSSPLAGAVRLLALALVAIFVAARRARRLETSYATD